MRGRREGGGRRRVTAAGQRLVQRTAVLALLPVVALAGCGAAQGEPEATVEVCVGEGTRAEGFTVEAVQDGEVVGSLTSDGVGDGGGSGDGPVSFSFRVGAGVSQVRFTDGEVIGAADLAPGGTAEWVVGEGCPTEP